MRIGYIKWYVTYPGTARPRSKNKNDKLLNVEKLWLKKDVFKKKDIAPTEIDDMSNVRKKSFLIGLMELSAPLVAT